MLNACLIKNKSRINARRQSIITKKTQRRYNRASKKTCLTTQKKKRGNCMVLVHFELMSYWFYSIYINHLCISCDKLYCGPELLSMLKE